MTIYQEIFWWSVLGLGLAISFLYSGAETGIYCLNRIRLHLLEHQNRHSARILSTLAGRPTTLLSTLLIGTNLGNYLGASAVAVLLESQALTEWQVVIANGLIVTPLLFIFVETLPKDLFSAHADKLMYGLADVVNWSRKLFTITGLVPLIAVATAGLMKVIDKNRKSDLSHSFHPRRQVETLVRESVGHGVITDEQSAMVERILDLSSITVEDEMTPWGNVKTVGLYQSSEVLWELADRTHHSRFPVVDKGGKVVGVANIYDALIHTREDCPPIEKITQPVLQLKAGTGLRDALNTLQSQRSGLAIVAGKGQPLGLVTIKDLVETITGELVSW